MWTLCDFVASGNLVECEQLLSTLLDPTAEETNMFADEGSLLSIAVQSENMRILCLLRDHWVEHHLPAARMRGAGAVGELRSIVSDVMFNEMAKEGDEMAQFLSAIVAEYL